MRDILIFSIRAMPNSWCNRIQHVGMREPAEFCIRQSGLAFALLLGQYSSHSTRIEAKKPEGGSRLMYSFLSHIFQHSVRTFQDPISQKDPKKMLCWLRQLDPAQWWILLYSRIYARLYLNTCEFDSRCRISSVAHRYDITNLFSYLELHYIIIIYYGNILHTHTHIYIYVGT